MHDKLSRLSKKALKAVYDKKFPDRTRFQNNLPKADSVKYATPIKKDKYEGSKKLEEVQTNVLHKFASYNSLFTLSGLSENEIKSQKYLTNTPHDVIARSGGISNPNISWGSYRHQMDIGGAGPDTSYEDFTDRRIDERTGDKISKASRKHTASFKDSVEILAKGHDLFFENLNILSTVGPNPERGLANFTKMEFELHEPFGVTLVEKMRASAFINGFKDYQDAPFLLTIEWKGNNKDGFAGAMPANSGELTTGFAMPVGVEIVKRKIPVVITRVEFDVDQGGAKYQAVAVTYGDLAMDDRFKYPRTNLNFSAYALDDVKYEEDLTINASYRYAMEAETMSRTDDGWISKVTKQLDRQMDDEIADGTRKLKDTYNFVVSPEIIKHGETYLKELVSIHSKDTTSVIQDFMKLMGSDSNFAKNMPKVKVKLDLTTSQADMNTALPKLFEDAIRTLVGYQELVERFWYSWGYARLKTTDGDEILKYYQSSQFDKDLEKHQFVDWFMIKPNVNTNTDLFDSVRKVHPKTITYYAIPVKIHILKFIKPGVSFGNVNWDKYVRKQYDYIYTGDNIDVQGLKIFYKTAYYMRNVRPIEKTIVEKGSYQEISESLERRINRVLGKEDHPYPEPDKPLRQEPSLIMGKSTVSSTDFRAHKSQEFYDYITNPQADMMRIELEILGDPAYICQDMYKTIPVGELAMSTQAGPFDYLTNSFNVEQYQPLIKLNYRLPDETNLKKGVMFEKQLSVGENLFFNGIYQVTKVDSRFQNGEFTQVLTCVRMNNQKGEGRTALITTSDAKSLNIGKKEDNLPTKKTEVVKAYSASEFANTMAGSLMDDDAVAAWNKRRKDKIKASKLKDSLIK